MYDTALVQEILNQILRSAQTITRRFASIRSPDDFSSSEAGLEKLDADCMQLVALGESVKNLDKISEGKILSQYPAIEWKRVMGRRDVISHHYFDLDAEIVYTVCRDHIATLAEVTRQILVDTR